MTEKETTSTRSQTKRRQGSKAIEVAKSKRDKPELGTIITTKTGVMIRIVPVAAHLLDEVMHEVKDPEIPVQYIEEKSRDEPNPFDKQYLKDLAEAEHARGIAASDTLILFGVELFDGMPEDDTWLKKLKWLEKKGKFDLSGYDLDDEMDLEFVYKKYYVVSARDIPIVGTVSGMSEEEIERAMRGFSGDEGEEPDSESEDQEPTQD
jgi:hypothetical protein